MRKTILVLVGASFFACTSNGLDGPNASASAGNGGWSGNQGANRAVEGEGGESRFGSGGGGSAIGGAGGKKVPVGVGGSRESSGGGGGSGTTAGGGGRALVGGGGSREAGRGGGGSRVAGSGGSRAGVGGEGKPDGGSPNTTADPNAGSAALGELSAYLGTPRDQRRPLDGEPFAQVPLTRELARQAADRLWQDHASFIQSTRKAEHDARAIRLQGKTLRYSFTVFGNKPAEGRSLFLSLHGGGNAEPSVNDEQWENQKTLYKPAEGIYLCPRAPTDTWNLWHEPHIDPMLERLIANLVVLEQVNPDRVYIMGYSAGGDGVYQLGPRMADHWAAAAAMAGHPNDAQPMSLRNLGFTIHVGALDTAYERNSIAQQWKEKLDKLAADEPDGYPHVVEVHANKPHWMDLEDAVAVPWMARFTRNPTPDTVVWYQDDVTNGRSYWLAVEPAQARPKTTVRATVTGQQIAVESKDVSSVKVRMSEEMLDLDQSVTITANGAERFRGKVPRTIATLAKTLEERGDPRLIFPTEVPVTIGSE